MQIVWICVIDHFAVHLANESLVIPVKVVDARTCLQSGLFGCINVGNTCAVSSAFVNFVNPQVVDCAITSIFFFNGSAAGISHGVTIDFASVIYPVHVLNA